MAAFVRVSGPANGNFLIGYPGISATMVSASPVLAVSGSPGLVLLRTDTPVLAPSRR